MIQRPDGRRPDQLRPVRLTPGYISQAEGSVLIEVGRTRVICTASVEEGVPPFLRGKGQGWITSEYGMLPRSTHTRTARESATGKRSGRTLEIQRLIGRSLRTAIDLDALGERTVWMDCDVIEADGGTRTASITGAYVALFMALDRLNLARKVIRCQVAAVSVGMFKGAPVLDLNYVEDSAAEVDFNVVMTDSGAFVEIQGTAEREPFEQSSLDMLLVLARGGIRQLIDEQRRITS